MGRLPDSRKVKHVDGVENKMEISTTLQQLPLKKSTRLPPLKSKRLPDIKPIQQSDIASTHASRPEFEARKSVKNYKVLDRKGTQVEYKATQNRDINERAINKNIPVIEKRHKPSDTQKENPKDKIFKSEVAVKRNDNICLEEINDSSSRSKLNPTRPNIHHEISKEVTWQKERDLLRKHRKQQTQRINVSRQPVKAIMAYDKTGKESKIQCSKQEKSVRNPCVRQQVDLSVSRKSDCEVDWDWDKDNEEIMKIEEKQKTRQHSTSGKCVPAQSGGKNHHQTPVILNCTKRGVGFKSKKRMKEEKQQELIRIENERKEKERIEIMIPQKIRKDLKKYGFR